MSPFRISLASLVLLAMAACKEDSPSGGGSIPDASVNPGDGGGGTDGGGPNPDGGPTGGNGFKITVTKSGVGVADVRIFFHDEAGALTGDFKTDASGVVSAAAAPKQVTALVKMSKNELITWTDVADGDSLSIEIPPDPLSTDPIGKWSLSLSDFTGTGTATTYRVSAWGCGGPEASAFDTTNPFVVDVRANCPTTGNVLIATASGGAGDLGYKVQKDVTRPAANATDSFALAGGWFDKKTFTVKAEGTAPSGTTVANSAIDLYVKDLKYGLPDVVGDVRGPNGDQYSYPIAIADYAVIQVLTSQGVQWTLGSAERVDMASPIAGTGDRSVSFPYTDTLPRVTDRSAKVAVAGRPEASWTPEAAIGGDGGMITISSQGGTTWTLIVSGPPTKNSIMAPALPADPGCNMPAAGATANVRGIFFKLSSTPTPKAFREMPINEYIVPSYARLLKNNGAKLQSTVF